MPFGKNRVTPASMGALMRKPRSAHSTLFFAALVGINLFGLYLLVVLIFAFISGLIELGSEMWPL